MSISFPSGTSWQAEGKCLTGFTSQPRERHSSAGPGACTAAWQPDAMSAQPFTVCTALAYLPPELPKNPVR